VGGGLRHGVGKNAHSLQQDPGEFGGGLGGAEKKTKSSGKCGGNRCPGLSGTFRLNKWEKTRGGPRRDGSVSRGETMKGQRRSVRWLIKTFHVGWGTKWNHRPSRGVHHGVMVTKSGWANGGKHRSQKRCWHQNRRRKVCPRRGVQTRGGGGGERVFSKVGGKAEPQLELIRPANGKNTGGTCRGVKHVD